MWKEGERKRVRVIPRLDLEACQPAKKQSNTCKRKMKDEAKRNQEKEGSRKELGDRDG